MAVNTELAFTYSFTGRHEVVITDKGESKEHVGSQDDVKQDGAVATLSTRKLVMRKLVDGRRRAV